MRARTRHAVRCLTCSGGVALFALLVLYLGPENLLSRLRQVGFGITWLLLAYAAGTCVGAVPWYWILPRSARPSLSSSVASRFAAAGVNAIVPLFGMAGEPCRLLWLSSQERTEGLAAILIDRTLFFLASALFLMAGVGAALSLPDLPGGWIVAGALTATVMALVALGVVWLGARHGIITPLLRALQWLRVPGLPRPAAEKGEHYLDAALAKLLSGRRSTLVVALALHLVSRALLASEVYAGLRLLGLCQGATTILVLAAIPVALGILGSLVPSQIGLQEGAFALVAKALGLNPTAGVALVLLQRLRQIVFVVLAGLLLAKRRKYRDASDA